MRILFDKLRAGIARKPARRGSHGSWRLSATAGLELSAAAVFFINALPAATFDRDANLVTTCVDGTATTNAPLGLTGLESLTPTAIMTTLVGSSGDGTESAYGAADDLGMWMWPLSAQEQLDWID